MHLHDYIKATPAHDARFVETWYLRQERSYLTQIKNSNCDQIGEAVYTGNKESAIKAHLRAVREVLEDVPEGCAPTVIMSLN